MASTLASTCSNHDANMTRTDKDHNRGKKPVSQPKANTNRTRRRGTKFEDAVLFENRVVDYTKGSLTGSWGDVWGKALEAQGK